MDIRDIGLAGVAGLCDAVAEIMSDQPTDDEKASLMAQVEGADRANVERFYEGTRAAFRRDPGNAVSLFLVVSLDDIRTLPEEERGGPLNGLLSLLEAAHERGHVTDAEAGEVVEQVGGLRVAGEADGR